MAEAIAILKFTLVVFQIVEKVLMSAVANAENNFDLDRADLVVMKPLSTKDQPLSGSAPCKGSVPINKRTSHITVVVSEK